jgi:predicted anti-sigma-YlaC factor YlaD
MHRSIRDRLEHLLAARGAAGEENVRPHLTECPECSSEFEAMRHTAGLLKSLRSVEAVEPEPGFYARVMQRIEETAKDSIWAVFIYSPFGKRLAYASLTIAVMLGTYVVTEESQEVSIRSRNVVARNAHYDPPVFGTQAQQRDAVLANFASHQGSLQ